MDLEVHRSLLVVVIHSRDPLRGAQLPPVMHKDHLDATLVHCACLHPGDLEVWKVPLTELFSEVWAPQSEEELCFLDFSRIINCL